MENNRKSFQFAPWHFIILIIGFYILTFGIYTYQYGIETSPKSEYNLRPYDKTQSTNGLSFVFVHDESESCQKMKQNVQSLAEKNGEDAMFYEVNLNDDSEFYWQHNISVLPNILVFNNETELTRLMGMISLENLELIYNKLINNF